MRLYIQHTVRVSDYHKFTSTFLVSSEEENTKFTFDSASDSSKKGKGEKQGLYGSPINSPCIALHSRTELVAKSKNKRLV